MKTFIKNSDNVMETGDHFKNGAILKSHTSRGIFFILACLVLLASLNGCKDDDGNEDGIGIPKVTYTGTASDGKEYSLEIAETTTKAAGDAIQEGDVFVLTVKSGGTTNTSKGTVKEVLGTIFTLVPSNAGEVTFTVMVSDLTITVIVGTITFTNNKTATAPGAFTIGSDRQYTDTRGNRITIPGGAASCAVRVVSFTHGSPWTSDPKAMDPNKILGAPDYNSSLEINYITLGISGEIVLEFGVNFTDGEGNDIYVFEIGPDVEATKVEISADLQTWVYVGDADGSLSGVDFSGKIPAGGKYKYVRLTDNKGDISSWAGADIDAVAIMYPILQ